MKLTFKVSILVVITNIFCSTVSFAKLSWAPPTHNVDHTPIAENSLIGYRIYFQALPVDAVCAFDQNLPLHSIEIMDPKKTSFDYKSDPLFRPGFQFAFTLKSLVKGDKEAVFTSILPSNLSEVVSEHTKVVCVVYKSEEESKDFNKLEDGTGLENFSAGTPSYVRAVEGWSSYRLPEPKEPSVVMPDDELLNDGWIDFYNRVAGGVESTRSTAHVPAPAPRYGQGHTLLKNQVAGDGNSSAAVIGSKNEINLFSQSHGVVYRYNNMKKEKEIVIVKNRSDEQCRPPSTAKGMPQGPSWVYKILINFKQIRSIF